MLNQFIQFTRIRLRNGGGLTAGCRVDDLIYLTGNPVRHSKASDHPDHRDILWGYRVHRMDTALLQFAGFLKRMLHRQNLGQMGLQS